MRDAHAVGPGISPVAADTAPQLAVVRAVVRPVTAKAGVGRVRAPAAKEQ
ncbi:hypothetical protein GPEL0_01r4677 [Geoanaerobacter pelophilus]|uniref:Uncharacterized protein n=1 Tax=Geoanaerobacter pelophilus TaxID=60036 RepID=A0ABQ0MMQ8_9BACT|nr:hypothetical protein GPEL0_01r4677 [Geoanaerobacter pelophilus]